MKKIFSQRLKELRLAAGLSGQKLGARIGVSKQTLSLYEDPKSTVLPSLATFVALAGALGVPLDVLAGQGEPPAREVPLWVADLLPDLEALPQAGREAVRVVVKGYAKKG